jgi:hypothetical protein
MRPWWRVSRVRRRLALWAVLCVVGCGGDPAAPAPALVIEKHPQQSGDGQVWETGHIPPDPFVVRVTEAGLAVAGVIVHWTPQAGSGWAVLDSSTTGADGTTGTQWRLGTTAGTHYLEASVDGAVGSPVVFTAVAEPNMPFALTAVSGGGSVVTLGGAQALVARVDDQFGNPFPGATVFWSVLSGPVVLDRGTTTSDASGLVLVEATAGPGIGPAVVHAWLAVTATTPTEYLLTVVP